jgi:hypothetical protein
MVIYNKFKEVAEKYSDKEIFLGQETKSYLGDKPETYFYFLERVNFTAEVLNFEIPEDYIMGTVRQILHAQQQFWVEI